MIGQSIGLQRRESFGFGKPFSQCFMCCLIVALQKNIGSHFPYNMRRSRWRAFVAFGWEHGDMRFRRNKSTATIGKCDKLRACFDVNACCDLSIKSAPKAAAEGGGAVPGILPPEAAEVLQQALPLRWHDAPWPCRRLQTLTPFSVLIFGQKR
jgi:hypothetical protein